MWQVLAGAVAGDALQLSQSGLWSSPAYAALLALTVLLASIAAWPGRLRRGRTWIAALAAACAMSGMAGLRAIERQSQRLAPELEGRELLLVGRVAGLPQAAERGVQFEFDVERATLQGRPVEAPRLIRLGWWHPYGASALVDAPPRVHAAQRWELGARLQRPHGLANPQGFDAERWLWTQGLGATGTVKPQHARLLPEAGSPSPAATLATARERVRDAILASVPDPRAAGVLAALVVGDQAAIDQADWQIFRVTGVAHLVSISGLHVTMFAWLAVWLVGKGWRGLARVRPALLLRWPAPGAAAIGGLALAVAYSAFAGWGVPAQRTLAMLAVGSALRLRGRRWSWPLVWLASMVAVLLLDPWALLQPGFWLSFVAVGVLFASSWLGEKPAGGWRAALRELLRTQATVTVALAPLTLLIFGQLSIAGLIANLFAVPWVTAIVTPLALLGAIFGPLWRPAAWSVQLMGTVLQWLAAMPGAVIERPELPALLALPALAGGLLLVARLPPAPRAWGALLAWPLLVWTPQRPAPGEFELVAPDVGQGGAVLVRTARHTLLHGSGPEGAAQRVLLPLLRAHGERPDAIVVGHADPASGLDSLLASYPRAELIASHAIGRPAQRCDAAPRWVWDGVEFEWLPARAGDDLQAGGGMPCVLRVASSGGRRVALLTGSIGARDEQRLHAALPALRADLLVAAYRGSGAAAGADWLDALRPRRVVVQPGDRSRHPPPGLLQRLRERGIAWVYGPDCGAASWRSDSAEAIDCHRAAARRYWSDSAPAADR